MNVKESIELLRNSHELKNKRWPEKCLDTIEEELEKQNKVIDNMAKTIIEDTSKLDTFWCNGCFKIAECPYNHNVRECVIKRFEKEE